MFTQLVHVMVTQVNRSSVGEPEPPKKRLLCQYLIKYSPDVLKAKVLDSFHKDNFFYNL